MTKITENQIELFAIDLLEKQGFQYYYGPTIARDGETPMRTGYDDVLLTAKLRNAIDRLNPNVPQSARDDALKQVQRIHSPQLIACNESFHRLLTEGVNVTYMEGAEERGDYVWLIDFDDPANNEFCAVNQFTVIENQHNKRPDLMLFINGIPLVVLELKNAVDENVTIKSAFKQICTYKELVPSLFTYNGFAITSKSF
jgi:type I restriction enzyme, R subunit